MCIMPIPSSTICCSQVSSPQTTCSSSNTCMHVVPLRRLYHMTSVVRKRSLFLRPFHLPQILQSSVCYRTRRKRFKTRPLAFTSLIWYSIIMFLLVGRSEFTIFSVPYVNPSPFFPLLTSHLLE